MVYEEQMRNKNRPVRFAVALHHLTLLKKDENITKESEQEKQKRSLQSQVTEISWKSDTKSFQYGRRGKC